MWHKDVMAFENAEVRKEYFRNYYAKKRAKYIDLLGGKCVECGSMEKLDFDHKDPSTKTFPIGKLMNFSEDIVLEELKKCQLLCEDCHDVKTLVKKDGYDRKAKGEQVGTAVLTEADVLKIRELLNTKSTVEIGRMYGVDRNTIYFIKIRRTWKHI